MRKNVKKAVSWIEEFERKATLEITRIEKVDGKLEGEVDMLKEEINSIKGDQGILKLSKQKIQNLLKALNGN